jgi:hypothetical protein
VREIENVFSVSTWSHGRDDGDFSSKIEKRFVLLVLLDIAFGGDVICLLE